MTDNMTTAAQDTKALAEAEQIRQDTEIRAAAAEREARKAELEARKLELDIAAAEAELVEKQAKSEVSALVRDREVRKEKAELAKDVHNNVYYFNGAVTGASANACIAQLAEWMRTKPGQDIEIVFNSPGGSVIDGLALYDFIQTVKAAGHHVTTSTIGYAASMGGILLQAGDKRVMGKESFILIHEIAFGAGGKIGEIEDSVEFGKKMQKRLLAILAERSVLGPKAIGNRWRRKDWWLDSDEALKYGFVDEVR